MFETLKPVVSHALLWVLLVGTLLLAFLFHAVIDYLSAKAEHYREKVRRSRIEQPEKKAK
jgi:type III secretory pathway component EscU